MPPFRDASSDEEDSSDDDENESGNSQNSQRRQSPSTPSDVPPGQVADDESGDELPGLVTNEDCSDDDESSDDDETGAATAAHTEFAPSLSSVSHSISSSLAFASLEEDGLDEHYLESLRDGLLSGALLSTEYTAHPPPNTLTPSIASSTESPHPLIDPHLIHYAASVANAAVPSQLDEGEGARSGLSNMSTSSSDGVGGGSVEGSNVTINTDSAITPHNAASVADAAVSSPSISGSTRRDGGEGGGSGLGSVNTSTAAFAPDASPPSQSVSVSISAEGGELGGSGPGSVSISGVGGEGEGSGVGNNNGSNNNGDDGEDSDVDPSCSICASPFTIGNPAVTINHLDALSSCNEPLHYGCAHRCIGDDRRRRCPFCRADVLRVADISIHTCTICERSVDDASSFARPSHLPPSDTSAIHQDSLCSGVMHPSCLQSFTGPRCPSCRYQLASAAQSAPSLPGLVGRERDAEAMRLLSELERNLPATSPPSTSSAPILSPLRRYSPVYIPLLLFFFGTQDLPPQWSPFLNDINELLQIFNSYIEGTLLTLQQGGLSEADMVQLNHFRNGTDQVTYIQDHIQDALLQPGSDSTFTDILTRIRDELFTALHPPPPAAPAPSPIPPPEAPSPDDPSNDPPATSSDPLQDDQLRAILDDLISPDKLYDHLPSKIRKSFTNAARIHLQRYSIASTQGNSQGMSESLIALLKLPSILLVKARGGKAGLRAMKRRMNTHVASLQKPPSLSLDEPVVGDLPPSVPPTDPPTLPPAPPPPVSSTARSTPRTLEEKQAQRVIDLAKRGHASRAIQHLLQERNDREVTEHTVNLLRDLHPQRSDTAVPLPSLPQDAPETPICKERTAKILKRIANGSAAGASGWNGDILLQVSQDEECFDLICTLLHDIVNGRLPDLAREVLLQGLLLGIPKDADEDSVRPIAIGDAFYKAACLHQLHLIRKELGVLFEPLQLAICAENGIERAIRALSAALEAGGDNCAALLVDFSNAFNTEDRASMLSNLYNKPSLAPIWRLAHLGYGQGPTSLAVRLTDGSLSRILSSQGSRQGDVLGILLFCLSVHPRFLASIAGLQSITAKAIADDFTVVGHHTQVIVALERLTQSCPNLNRAKTKILWPHSNPIPEDLSEAAQRLGVPIVREGSKLLGSFLSLPRNRGLNSLAAQFLNTVVDKHRNLFELIKHPLIKKQIALNLLRVCIQPRMVFHARVTDPATGAYAFQLFDDLLFEVARHLLSLEGETPALLQTAIDHYNFTPYRLSLVQAKLPLRMGGIGLRTTSDINFPAFWASSVAAHREVHAIFQNGNTNPNNLNFQNSSIFADLRFTLDHLSHNEVPTTPLASLQDALALERPPGMLPPYLPSTPDNLHSFYGDLTSLPHTLQKLLTAQWEHIQLIRLNAQLHPRHKARILSASSPGASAWLSLLPNPNWNEALLNDDDVTAALRFRLGMPHTFVLKTHCCCGQSICGPNADPYHFFSCPRFKRRQVLHRHDKIKVLLSGLCNLHGLPCELEPESSCNGIRRKPDLGFHLPSTGQGLYVDVTVVSSTSPSNLESRTSLASCLDYNAQRKVQKYYDFVQAEDAAFLPFAVDTFGALHSSARKVINVIRGAAVRFFLIEESEASMFTAQVLASISTRLQVGNTQVMFKGFGRASGHVGGV